MIDLGLYLLITYYQRTNYSKEGKEIKKELKIFHPSHLRDNTMI